MNDVGGRPSMYSIELANKICEELAQGKSLRSVCREEGMPSLTTVFNWFRIHKEFLDQYARACEERVEAQHEELTDLGNAAIELSQKVDPKSSGAVVQAFRLKADNLKWSMSKMKPKKYGEKLDLTTDGEKLPTPIYGGKSTERV